MNFDPPRLWKFTRRICFITCLAILIKLSATPTLATRAVNETYSWLEFNFDAQHSGNNINERTITLANVSHLHQLFQTTLVGTHLPVVDGAPVYLDNVATPDGLHNMLFMTTMAGDIIAVDAIRGVQLWRDATAPAESCRINNVENGPPCYTTSSPAIDPNRRYVYSYGLDGYVHKYSVGDGTEIQDDHWPELVTTKAYDEKGSSALSVATDKAGNDYLYMTTAGYPGDHGDYQGHLTAINLKTGEQHVFNVLCSGDGSVHFQPPGSKPDCSSVQAGIWARSGAIYDPDTDKIYIVTGNADYDPAQFDWGDTVLALHPDGTGDKVGNPLDSYTPANYEEMNTDDLDLGSSAPAVLPVINGHHYGIEGGKDSNLRILDLDDLSQQGGPGHVGGEVSGALFKVPQQGQILMQSAIWTNPADSRVWVFVGTYQGLTGLMVNPDGTGLETAWVITNSGCSSPIIANGVLFCAGFKTIHAYDPTTGAEKWNADVGTLHWQSPIVANGILYMTDNSSQLTAYTVDN